MIPKDGHLPIRFDVTMRKTLSMFSASSPKCALLKYFYLGSFIASLTPLQPTIVVFLVLPLSTMSLSSPILRQILAVATKIFNMHHSNQLSLQFVPEQHLFSAMERSPAVFNCSLDQLCLAVYNRLPVAVDRVRTMISNSSDNVSDLRSYFSAPSITLARPVYNQVSYVRAAHPSLDVLDRYTLLHIGYHLTNCGRWIIACGVDQRGEMHEVGVWLTREAGQGDPEGDPETHEADYAVNKVWDFGMQLARKANVEWRVVFTRLGVINEKELHGTLSCFFDDLLAVLIYFVQLGQHALKIMLLLRVHSLLCIIQSVARFPTPHGSYSLNLALRTIHYPTNNLLHSRLDPCPHCPSRIHFL